MSNFVIIIDDGQFTLGHEEFPFELILSDLLFQFDDALLLLEFLYLVKSVNQLAVETAYEGTGELA